MMTTRSMSRRGRAPQARGGGRGWRGAGLGVVLLLAVGTPGLAAPLPLTTGAWYAVDPLIRYRGADMATLLPSGQVLIAGGCLNGACDPAYKDYASAEVYNLTTGTWRLVGKMTEPRSEPSATLLPDGQVLVAGGANALHGGGGIEGQPLASAELYNPRTGTFTATASMTDSLDLHTATLLPYGGVLVAGGCAFSPGSGQCVGELKNTADVYWYK